MIKSEPFSVIICGMTVTLEDTPPCSRPYPFRLCISGGDYKDQQNLLNTITWSLRKAIGHMESHIMGLPKQANRPITLFITPNAQANLPQEVKTLCQKLVVDCPTSDRLANYSAMAPLLEHVFSALSSLGISFDKKAIEDSTLNEYAKIKPLDKTPSHRHTYEPDEDIMQSMMNCVLSALHSQGINISLQQESFLRKAATQSYMNQGVGLGL